MRRPCLRKKHIVCNDFLQLVRIFAKKDWARVLFREWVSDMKKFVAGGGGVGFVASCAVAFRILERQPQWHVLETSSNRARERRLRQRLMPMRCG